MPLLSYSNIMTSFFVKVRTVAYSPSLCIILYSFDFSRLKLKELSEFEKIYYLFYFIYDISGEFYYFTIFFDIKDKFGFEIWLFYSRNVEIATPFFV